MPSYGQYISVLAGAFRNLGDRTRLRILMELKDAGERNVTELRKKLRLPQPSVSHHLAILRKGGLVKPRRSGKEIYYSLRDIRNDKSGRALYRWLDKDKAVRIGPFVMGLAKKK